MNNIRRACMMLLLWAAGLSGLRAGNTWLKEPVTALDEALKNPSSVKSLVIDCGSKDVQQFIKNSGSFTGLQNLVVKNATDKISWDKLVGSINPLPGLTYLEFSGVGFAKMPAEFSELKNIQTIAFSGYYTMDLEQLADKLAELDNLKELKLEVFSVNELPENLADISSLDKLSIFDKEIVFGSQRKEDGEENLKTESDFTINWIDDLKAKRDLRVNYFSIGESISGEDMYAMSNLYPNVDLSGFTSLLDPRVKQLGVKDEFARWDKKYNYVKPPIPNVDVEKQYFSVNTITGGDFTYATGTRISIPPYAFVHKDGTPVSGKVVIDYREFRDAADILASGIPMTYDSGGVMNNFESAGMLEINASQNGEEVFLKGGKQISMDFSSVDDATTYNLYAFDDKGTGNWNLLGKAGKIKKVDPNALKILSNAYTIYRNYMNYNSITAYDSTPFKDRFGSDLFTYDERNKSKGKWRKVTASMKDKWLSLKSDGNKKKVSWLVKPVVVVQKDGQTVFTLKYVPSKLTELNYFADVKWMTDGKIKASQFRRELSFKNFYNDMRIEKDGDSYLLTFKGRNGYQEVHAKPVMYNTHSKKVILLKDNGEKRYKRYMRMMRYKERNFNRALKLGKVENNNFVPYTAEEKSKYCWSLAKKQMASGERLMSYEDWIIYYDKVIKNEKELTANSNASAENIIRSFTLDGMGIYNCDQIRRIPSPMTVYAKFMDKQDGTGINAKTTYIVMKGINSVFSYGSWNSKDGAMEVSFGRNSTNVMLTIDHDGSVSLLTPQEFKKENFSGRMHTFGMNYLSDKISSVGELRELMGLK